MMLAVLLFNLSVAVLARENIDPVSSALCRTRCLYQLLAPGARQDRDCAVQPDCFLCWEHCGILSNSNASREILCKDDNCSEGCQASCKFFGEPQVPSRVPLVFPNDPTLEDGVLSWTPVPNADLYSVSLVYFNRTMRNIAQTASFKLKIPKAFLFRVSRIVVIAVNNTGALGIANYNLGRRIVKKNVSSAILQLKEAIEYKEEVTPSPVRKPVLKVKQGVTEDIDETLVKSEISWSFVDTERYPTKHEFLVKWWIPDLDMEGRSVINGSQSTELTFLSKYICLVKVKVMHTELESQVLVLKRNQPNLKTPNQNFVISSFLCASIIIFFVLSLIITKLINNCNLREFSENEEKSVPFCDV